MEKTLKKQFLLENLRITDRILNEYLITPLIELILDANENQINSEYKKAIQQLNRKPDDIYDKYRWYFDFDDQLKLINS